MLRLFCLWAVFVSVSASEAARHFIFRSEDRGRSWVQSDSGLPGDSRINAFAEAGGAVMAGTDAGIFLSRDSGKTWENSNVTGTNSVRVIAAAAIDRRLFAAGTTFLLVSADAGRTWLTNGTFPRRIVRSLFAHRNVLYVGTDANGAYRSADLGRTWTHLAEGLPDSAQVLAFASFGNNIFAGLYGKGLFRWQQADGKWIAIGAAEGIKPLALATTARALMAGHNPGGIHRSADGGRTWEPWSGETTSTGLALAASRDFEFALGQAPVSLEAPIWEMAADNEIAFAGAADGIFYSEDHGRSWTRSSAGLPNVSPGVAFLVRSNFVLAATLSNHKSYSANTAK